jgi:hypothetical protein
VISLFCPSRGRPQAAKELMRTFEETKTSPDTELVFCIDKDDPTRKDYPTSLILGEPTGDPTGPSNHAALASSAPIIGWVGDDSRFETKGWDAMVIAALRTPGFCWTWDGHETPWPSTVFISREIVQALGYLILPTMKRGYFDTVWIALAGVTGTDRILYDVMIRHDNTVHEAPDPQIIAADHLAYIDWFKNQYDADAKKVRSVELSRFFGG